MSVERTARLAGGLHLSLVPFGIFSFVYVPAVLVARGDAAATSRNILASETLFRSGIASHLVSQLLVVFLALALYRLLRPVSRDHAPLVVILPIVGVAISFVAEIDQLAVLQVLGGTGGGVFTTAQRESQAMLLLDRHRSGVLLAQAFWGLWLVGVGSLVIRSRFLPRALGVSVLIGAAGYLIDSAAHLLAPGAPTISQVTFLGELLLPLWLLIKGVDVEAWRSRAGSTS